MCVVRVCTKGVLNMGQGRQSDTINPRTRNQAEGAFNWNACSCDAEPRGPTFGVMGGVGWRGTARAWAWPCCCCCWLCGLTHSSKHTSTSTGGEVLLACSRRLEMEHLWFVGARQCVG